jgi:hypothetical protein
MLAIAISLLFLLLTPPAPIRADEGWSPADQGRWMDAQMNYAKAVRQYGKESPEATGAQVLMNTLARELGVEPPTAVPATAAPNSVMGPDTYIGERSTLH